MVQYALQMLHEAGGHTGVWPHRPAHPAPGRRHPRHGHAGAPGHHRAATPRPRRDLPAADPQRPRGGNVGSSRRKGRGKVWLIAMPAVIAVAAGVAFALQYGKKDDDKQPTKPKTSVTQDKTP
ncbi:non-specific serine/threonine protein kinase OS=Streptomyces antimycoticus OX=68175 GN=SSPO_050480 PE=4 SV=1 [Streptomyces antimycoticus]